MRPDPDKTQSILHEALVTRGAITGYVIEFPSFFALYYRRRRFHLDKRRFCRAKV